MFRVMEFHTLNRSVHTHSMQQVRKNIYTSSIGKWTKYADQLKTIRKLLRPSLKKMLSENDLPFASTINWQLDPNFTYGRSSCVESGKHDKQQQQQQQPEAANTPASFSQTGTGDSGGDGEGIDSLNSKSTAQSGTDTPTGKKMQARPSGKKMKRRVLKTGKKTRTTSQSEPATKKKANTPKSKGNTKVKRRHKTKLRATTPGHSDGRGKTKRFRHGPTGSKQRTGQKPTLTKKTSVGPKQPVNQQRSGSRPAVSQVEQRGSLASDRRLGTKEEVATRLEEMVDSLSAEVVQYIPVIQKSLPYPSGDPFADEVCAVGILLFNLGRLSDCIAILEPLIEYQDGLFSAYVGIGSAYAMNGQLRESLDTMNVLVTELQASGKSVSSDVYERRAQVTPSS
jgi:hypothetical protein